MFSGPRRQKPSGARGTSSKIVGRCEKDHAVSVHGKVQQNSQVGRKCQYGLFLGEATRTNEIMVSSHPAAKRVYGRSGHYKKTTMECRRSVRSDGIPVRDGVPSCGSLPNQSTRSTQKPQARPPPVLPLPVQNTKAPWCSATLQDVAGSHSGPSHCTNARQHFVLVRVPRFVGWLVFSRLPRFLFFRAFCLPFKFSQQMATGWWGYGGGSWFTNNHGQDNDRGYGMPRVEARQWQCRRCGTYNSDAYNICNYCRGDWDHESECSRRGDQGAKC